MNSSFAFLPNIGPLEIAILLVILLVIFGPKRIPAAFRSMADALRGFRDTVSGEEEEAKKPATLVESSRNDGQASAPGDQDSGAAGHSGDKSGAKTDA
ncbi:MAG: twin-arginine translocase TatA/TatE family subunit [Solirubrobacterales bacterium]